MRAVVAGQAPSPAHAEVIKALAVCAVVLRAGFAAAATVSAATRYIAVHLTSVARGALFLLWTLDHQHRLLRRTREREAAQAIGREVAARA